MMVQLSLIWVGLGMLVGLVAWGAWPKGERVHAPANSLLSRVPVVVLVMFGGAVMALAGGWVGVLLDGQFLATGMALWVSIVGALVGLWGMKRLSRAKVAG